MFISRPIYYKVNFGSHADTKEGDGGGANLISRQSDIQFLIMKKIITTKTEMFGQNL